MINIGDFFISKSGNGMTRDYYCICQLNNQGRVKTISFPQKFKNYAREAYNNPILNNYISYGASYFEEIDLTDPNFIEALSTHIIREDSKVELKQFLINLVQKMFKETNIEK